jgi:hypothetical protein
MRGVWYTGFEESLFIPGIDTVALHREIGRNTSNPEFDTWLDIDREEALSRMRLTVDFRSRAFAITFVGRRSLPHRNLDGSVATQIVIVDALLSGRLLGEVETCIRRDLLQGGHGTLGSVIICPDRAARTAGSPAD